MKDGQEIAIDANTSLKIFLPPNDEDYDSNGDKENSQNTSTASERQAEWNDAATKLLIELYKGKKALVEQRKLKSMKQMWEIIKGELNTFGHEYSAARCENKWKSLERSFKNRINNNNKTGRGRKNCPYER